ncbi:hypothetical protein ACLOJK_028149 [Asimina triloba]
MTRYWWARSFCGEPRGACNLVLRRTITRATNVRKRIGTACDDTQARGVNIEERREGGNRYVSLQGGVNCSLPMETAICNTQVPSANEISWSAAADKATRLPGLKTRSCLVHCDESVLTYFHGPEWRQTGV